MCSNGLPCLQMGAKGQAQWPPGMQTTLLSPTESLRISLVHKINNTFKHLGIKCCDHSRYLMVHVWPLSVQSASIYTISKSAVGIISMTSMNSSIGHGGPTTNIVLIRENSSTTYKSLPPFPVNTPLLNHQLHYNIQMTAYISVPSLDPWLQQWWQ